MDTVKEKLQLDDLLAKGTAPWEVWRSVEPQANKPWFSDEPLPVPDEDQGRECASQYAEAFYGRKLVIE
jgi:hypothetical protein